MINYELAKKLKDAGFSQDYHDCVGDRSGNCICENNRIIRDVTIPTLSELIKSVTTDYDLCDFSLSVTFFEGENGKLIERWRARKNDGEHNDGNIMGSSPEEAVANLWLSFNKK